MTPVSLCNTRLILGCRSVISASSIYVPLGQTVLDVVQCRIDEYSGVIPCTRFDTYGLMNEGVLTEVLVRNGDRYRPRSVDTSEIGRIYALCLLMRATMDPSMLQMTYLTGGLLISASVFCCKMRDRSSDAFAAVRPDVTLLARIVFTSCCDGAEDQSGR